jgi:hypothetical protein
MLAISVIDDVAQYLAQGTIPPREGEGSSSSVRDEVNVLFYQFAIN